MAVQTIYILGTTAAGPNWFGNTQLNGTAPATATTAFGWVPAKTSISTPYFRSRLGATAPASDAGSSLDPVGSVNAPTPGTGSGAATAGDCFIAGPFNGTFANGTWTFNWNLRASTAGCVGRVGMKIYRSVNANGSPASQVKSESSGTTVTLSTTADTNSQIVWGPGATVTLNNEYLFFQLVWQETTQGTSNGCNVFFRTGTSSITTPDFVYTPQTVQASALIADPVLNWIHNSRAEGAVAGTPGTAPWQTNPAPGLTQTIVGTGVEDGIPYVDFRWFGTTTQSGLSGSYIYLDNPTAPQIPASYQMPYTRSIYTRLVAGSVAHINQFIFVNTEYDAANVNLGASNYTTLTAPSSGSLGTTRRSSSGTIANQTAVWVCPTWYFETSLGAVIDITVRIGGPQWEADSTLSPLALAWPGSLMPATLSATGIQANAIRGAIQASALIAGTGGAPVNYILNPRAQGGDVANNYMPTYWQAFALSGVTQTLVASGVLADGTPYADIRYSGVPTATYVVAVFSWGAVEAPNFAIGVPITLSAYMAIVGGSMANIASVDLSIRFNSAFGGGLTTAFSLTSTLTRYSTTTSGTAGQPASVVTGGWQLDFTAGLPIDITIRFALPQLEIGNAPTAPILPSAYFGPAQSNYAITARGIFANASGGRDVSPNKFALSFAPGPDRESWNGDIGVQFVAANALTFNRIGIRCPTNGTGIHTLKLRNVTLNLLAQSVTIDLTGCTTGAYYYATIPATTLNVGHAYFLATNVTAGDGQTWPDQGPTALRGVQGGTVVAAYSGADTNPAYSTSDFQYYGVDLDYVPPPVAANAIITGFGGYSNFQYNPRHIGAVVGGITDSPTLPTGWSLGIPGGMQYQVVALGNDPTTGLPYIDLRFVGTTNTAGGNIRLNYFAQPSLWPLSWFPPATAGQTWTQSLYLGLIAGSQSGISFTLGIYGVASDGNLPFGPPQNYVGALPSGTVQRYTQTQTIPLGGTSAVLPTVQFTWPNATAIDFTIRICGEQLELNSIATLPVILPPPGQLGFSSFGVQSNPGIAINASALIAGHGGQTNINRNPRAEGAVAGTPGTMPTFWAYGSNVPLQVVGTGIDVSGIPYVDIRLFGTVGSNNEQNWISVEDFSPFPAARTSFGETWTQSAYCSLVGGSLANIASVGMMTQTRDVNGGYLGASSAVNFTPTNAPLSASRRVSTGTITNPTAYISTQLFLIYGATAGQPMDLTLRIGGPQLEIGPVATPLILPPVGFLQPTTRGLLAAPGSFTPTGATINGTGSVGASIAPVAVPTRAIIAGGEANRVPLQALGPSAPNTVVVSTDIVPPPGAGGIVFKHTRGDTVSDNNCGVAWTSGMPLVPYTFKVMVWIPAGWGGSVIYFTTEGNVSAAIGIAANLSLTNQWQLVTGHAIPPTGEVALVARCNDATATPYYTAAWQAIPDTVVAIPTVFGNVRLGGVGSVTANAYTLAQTATTIAGQGGRTNWIRNPRAEGAVVPNALPNYWAAYLDSGLALQVVGTGTEGGLSYVDVRLYGTSAGPPQNLAMQLFVDGGNPIAASPGQTWTQSIYVRLMAGAIPFAFQVLTYLEDAATNVITYSFTTPQSFAPTNAPLATQRLVTSGTISDPTARYVAANIWVYYNTTGQAVDCTLRIASPQLESGALTGSIWPPAGQNYFATRALEADAGVFKPTSAQIDGRGGQTNYVRNPRAEGAVVGSPGTLPTFWTVNPLALSQQIIGTGTDVVTGLSYIDIRLSGNVRSGISRINVESTTNIVAASGDRFVVAGWLALVDGSTTNIGYVALQGSGIVLQPTLQQFITSTSGSNAAAAYIEIVTGALGGPVDLTLRIAGFQFERGTVATPLILPPVGTPGVSSRALLAAATTRAQTQAWINASDRGQTFDPLSVLFLGQQTFLSNANCSIAHSPVDPFYEDGARGDGYVSAGKFYAEFTPQSSAAWNYQCVFGITDATTAYWDILGSATNSCVFQPIWGVWTNGATSNILTNAWTAEPAAMAVDLVNRRVWFRLLPSGLWNGSASGDPTVPSTGIDISTLPLSLTTVVASGGTVAIGGTINMGNTPFLGAVPAGFSGFPVTPGGGHVSATAFRVSPAVAGIGGEGGQTNWVRNPRAEGAITGTPGTLPTFWTESSAGYTRQIVGSGIDAATGLSYVDVRYSWSNTNGFQYLFIESNVYPIAANGDTFVSTVWLAMVGGSMTNIVEVAIFFGMPQGIGQSANLPLTAALAPYTLSRTATSAGSVGNLSVRLTPVNGFDITLRVAGAQLERGTVRTPPILPPIGAPHVMTRALLAMATTLAQPQQIIAGQGGKTNFITNPRAEGAVFGSPGTLPTGWFNSRMSGLTRTIVGTGTEAGIPYIDFRFSGTSTDVVVDIGFTTGSEVRANTNDVVSVSAFLKIVGGDASQIIFNLHAQATNANGFYVTEPYIPVAPFDATTPLDQARCATITTFLPGWIGTYYTRPILLLRFLSQLAIDVTVRIGAPQLEALNTTSLMLPPIGAPQRAARGVEALPNQIVQAQAQINGEGLIHAESTFVGQARANATLAGVGSIIISGLRQRVTAHAALHGTGSVTATFSTKDTAKARLTGVGGVQATPGVLHPTFARIRGAGWFTAISSRVRPAETTIAGHGGVRATGFPAQSGETEIDGAGLLRVRDTAVAVLQMAAALITGDAAVRLQGRRAPPCDGLIEAEGTVYATATVRAAGQALVAGDGTPDAHGTAWRIAAALLNGVGEVRGLLNHRPVAEAGIGGVGQVAADGTPIRQTYGVSALIAGVGRVRADAFRAATVMAEALIAGLGAVLASGMRAAVVNVDKTIAGVGTVRATATRVVMAAGATIAGSGSVRANPSQIGAHNAAAQIDGSSWLSVDSVTVTQVQAGATIQGVGGAVARGARAHPAGATITGAGSIAASGSVWAPALAMIAGAGALVAGHRKAPFPVYARTGGEGSVSAVAQVLVSTHVRIAGRADLADVAGTLYAEAAVAIRVHGWVIERAKAQLGAEVVIEGGGDLGFDGEQMSHRHTGAVIRGVGQVHDDPGVPREQIAAQGVHLPPSLEGVSVL